MVVRTWPAVKALLEDVTSAALLPAGGVRETPTHIALALGKYQRAAQIYEAAKLVTLALMPESTLVLARPLMTEALQLMDVAAATPRARIALLIGWEMASVHEAQSLMEYARGAGIGSPEELDRVDTELRNKLRKAQGYAQRHQAGKPRTFAGESTLARRHQRTQEYFDHKYASNAIHGSSFTLPPMRPLSARTTGMFLLNDDPGWLQAAGMMVMGSILDAQAAVVRILDVDRSPAVVELDRRYRELEKLEQAPS